VKVFPIRAVREDMEVFRDDVIGFSAPLAENIRILKYTNLKLSIA
jgi:hypothetical protein